MTAPVTDPATPPVPAPPTDPAPPAVPPTPVVEAQPPKAETDWVAESRKWEARAKENSKAAKELADLRAAQMSDAEKAAARAEAAEKRAADLTDRTVRAEVKALAANTFEDPSDAEVNVTLSKYVGDDGEIDTAAIEADLAEVLKRKPHLAKATGPSRPKPDPSQGARPDGTPSVDQRIAEAEKAGDVKTSTALKLQKLEATKTK